MLPANVRIIQVPNKVRIECPQCEKEIEIDDIEWH